ncbi:hypothetical protein UB45_10940 [Terrabacter sp. 28]|nr:hypothetical protein UB45_10940 [Terrabacter sp. 28]
MSAITLLERAAAELHCAADQAEARAEGNPLDPWAATAGTIRLVAAGLHPMPASLPIQATTLHEHLTAALAALDELPASEAPDDLPFWRAHVHDLSANVDTLESVTERPPTGAG